jgi:hypothetical protein
MVGQWGVETPGEEATAAGGAALLRLLEGVLLAMEREFDVAPGGGARGGRVALTLAVLPRVHEEYMAL